MIGAALAAAVVVAVTGCPGGYPVHARPGRIIDGDTFEATATVLPNLTMALRVRMLGIDAPELHGGTAEERKRAVMAKDYLSERLVAVDTVDLCVTGTDSFGRYLARVYTGREDLSATMLKLKLAAPYEP